MVIDLGDKRRYGEPSVSAIEITHDRDVILKLAEEARDRGGQVLVDAGCGGLVSLNSTGGTLVVAENPGLFKVNIRGVEVDDRSTVIGFDGKVDELFGLGPDLILYVAPDPGEIGPILYEAERTKGDGTKILIVFDNTSNEGTRGGLRRGIDEAKEALRDMRMKPQLVVADIDAFPAVLRGLGVRSGGNISSSHIFGGRVTYLVARAN